MFKEILQLSRAKVGSRFILVFCCARIRYIIKNIFTVLLGLFFILYPTFGTQYAGAEDEIEPQRESKFYVVDEYMDAAFLGNGKIMYKIYNEPRVLEQTVQGLVAKEGWNYFDEKDSSRLRESNAGYEYRVETSAGDFHVLAGDMEIIGLEKRILPGFGLLRREASLNSARTVYENVFAEIDFSFTDSKWKREKSIVIKQPSDDFKNADKIIFWEQINIPESSFRVMSGADEITQRIENINNPVKIILQSGETFMIGKSVIFDSSIKGKPEQELKSRQLSMIVEPDFEGQKVMIGIVVEASYLNNPHIQYPVTIDPNYIFCKEGTVPSDYTSLTCWLSDFYLRSTNGGASHDGNNWQDTDALYVGKYYDSGLGKYLGRHSIVSFQNFDPDKIIGNVLSAKLNLKYHNYGYGTALYQDIEAYRINGYWNPFEYTGLNYPYFRGTTIAENIPVRVYKTPTMTDIALDITETAKQWKLGAPYDGIMIEPSPMWSSGTTPPSSWEDLFLVFESKENTSASSPYMTIITEGNQYVDLTYDAGTHWLNKTQYNTGETIQLHHNIENFGNAAASSHLVSYYLCPGSVCYDSQYFIGSKNISSVQADGYAQVDFSYQIPSSLASGQYYISYYIDSSQQISESNENNNKASLPLQIVGAVKPDLLLSIYQNLNNSYEQGQQIVLKYGVTCFDASCGASKLYAYFKSGSPVYENQYRVKDIDIPALSKDESYQDIEIYYVPKTAPPGQYSIYLFADSLDQIYESNESNNKFQKSINVTQYVPKQDLYLTDVSIIDAGVTQYWGNKLKVQATVHNNGTVSASSFFTGILLKNLSTGSMYSLPSVSPITSLGANASQTVTYSGLTLSDCSLPLSGTYSAIVTTDLYNDFIETNENNNSATSNNTVNIVRYDLCSGGGGGSEPPPNQDGDPYSDAQEVATGNNAVVADPNAIFNTAYSNSHATASDKKDEDNHGGDPVNLRNGALEFSQTDFVLSGRGKSLEFKRTYNSKLSDREGRLGFGWTYNYNQYAYQDLNTKNIQLYLEGTEGALFTTSDNGATFTAPRGDASTLSMQNGFPVYRTISGETYIFGTDVGENLYLLTEIKDRNNNSTLLNYSLVRGIPLLSSITDPSGRILSLFYGSDTDELLWDKIIKIQDSADPANLRIVLYSYDSSGNLIKVHKQNIYGAEIIDINHEFIYDPNHLMQKYADPRGTILYNEYDGDGRVIIQKEYNPRIDAIGAGRTIYEMSYSGADAQAPGSSYCTSLTTHASQTKSFFEKLCYNSDNLKIYKKDGMQNVKTWTYNADGMPSSFTDENGTTAYYSFDSKKRKIEEILPDAGGFRTKIFYSYEDSFNQITKKEEKVFKLPDVSTPILSRATLFEIDSDNGNILSITDPMNKKEIFSYDGFGNILAYTDKNGSITNYSYGTGGNYLIQEAMNVVQADNSAQLIKKQYNYNSYGQKISYIGPNGKTYLYDYDSFGNVRKETDPLGNNKLYKYDAENNLIEQTNALGKITKYDYDTDIEHSLLSSSRISGAGNITNYRQYDWVGNLIKEIDLLGNEISYAYNNAEKIISKADAFKTTYIDYNAYGLVVKETSSVGEKTEYFYDSRGNKAEIRKYYDESNFVSNKFGYDGFGRLVSQTDGNGNLTAFSYDLLDRLVSKTDSLNNVFEYFYDNAGNKIGERLPRASVDSSLRNSDGYSTSYYYDVAGRMIKQINADNKITLHFYDANNNVIKIIDRQGAGGSLNNHVFQYEYYDNNLKKSETDSLGGRTEYAYYNDGALKTKKDQMNRIAEFFYDDFARLISVKDPAGYETKYGYDKNGNKTSVIYPDNTSAYYSYDELNHLIQIKDALNGIQKFEYNAIGLKSKEKDKLGNATLFAYDALGRLASETNPAGTITSYAYDNNNNLLSEKIGDKIKAFSYDKLNRPIIISHYGNKTEKFAYDADGNKILYTDGKNQATNYVYDKLGRNISKILSDGKVVNYSYDNWNNLTLLTDESGSTQYAYDALNRNVNETKTFAGLAGKNYIIKRSYNADSRMSSLTDAANRKFDYFYNSRGLLDSVKFGQTVLALYSYLSTGQPKKIIYGNGVFTDYDYDVLGRVLKIETKNNSSTLFLQEYAYDAQGNCLSMKNGFNDTTIYDYDNLEQLTDVNIIINGNQNAFSYVYDIYGNRISQTSPFGSASFSYKTDSNELNKTAHNNRLAIDSEYDNNGSLIKETYIRLGKAFKNIAYSWNSQNRLARITYVQQNQPLFLPILPPNIVSFQYDDFGNRIKKQTNNNTTYYLNDGLSVLNELDNQGNILKSVIGGVSEIDKNGTIYYIHHDSLGSAVLTTDENANIVSQYDYDPFGQIIGAQMAENSTRYLYTGQEYDIESDLYYYNARYYNPVIGRFISRDSILGKIGDALSKNGYIYVLNNPLKYVDPRGEEAEEKTALVFYGDNFSYWYKPSTWFKSDFFLARARFWIEEKKKEDKSINFKIINGSAVKNWEKALEDNKNIHIIAYFGHGYQSGLSIGENEYISTQDSSYYDPHTDTYVESLSKKNISPNANIYIFSCHAASNGATVSIAQNFANHFEVPVFAARGGVNFDSKTNLPIVKSKYKDSDLKDAISAWTWLYKY